MKTCPWCGFENLNVYIYCQRCGRGFEEPPGNDREKKPSLIQRLLNIGRKAA